MQRRRGYNPKRKIASKESLVSVNCAGLARRAAYGGNPEHKRSPGDFDLMPPVNPRPGKTLCDATSPVAKVDAKRLLRSGLRKGMISEQWRGGWPKNVWAVDREEAFEAQLENSDQGMYHGYPMPIDDDFRKIVLIEWAQR
jgi:hypothetical protein